MITKLRKKIMLTFLEDLKNKFRGRPLLKLLSLKDIELVSQSMPNLDESNYIVHFLWVEGTLSRLESLSINSFIKNGFTVYLWSYDQISNPPQGVVCRDGNDVISEKNIFRYKNGSLAGFANVFRYELLVKFGGIWADTDVICLINFDEFKRIKVPFIVTEFRSKTSISVNNNLIFQPKSASANFLEVVSGFSKAYDSSKLNWGDCGPKLLNLIARNYPAVTPVAMTPNFANPFDWFNCPEELFSAHSSIPEDCYFLHCYNETWRSGGYDKNSAFPAGSLIEKLYNIYCLDENTEVK